MEICFDPSWTLTFLPIPWDMFQRQGTWWLCSTNTAVDGDKQKRRTLQPCPRVVQVKINMPTNNWITFSPVPPRNFLREQGFILKNSYPKKILDIFLGKLTPQKWILFHRYSILIFFPTGPDSYWEVLPTPTSQTFQPQPPNLSTPTSQLFNPNLPTFQPQPPNFSTPGGRKVGLHLYGKPSGKWRC